MPNQQDQHSSVGEPQVRSTRWFGRMVKWWMRRDIEKTIRRIESAREVVWMFDEESAHMMTDAAKLLTVAKEKERERVLEK